MSREQGSDRAPAAETLLFIGGLHRSGTSLLARCLADHPQTTGFTDTGVEEDEGQHLQSVYPPGTRYGGPGRFGFSAEMHLTEDSLLVTDANRARLLSQWSPHWDLERPVRIEKSPPNLLKTRFLQAMFPSARFIMVMRHPIATSLATQKWSQTSMESLIEHWLVCNEKMVDDLSRLEHVTLLRYEDFVLSGDKELMRLHRFIGVQPQRYGLEPERRLNAAYVERWNRLGYPARWGRLGSRLPQSPERRSIKRRFEERVNRFGYSLRDPEQLAERESLLAALIPAKSEHRVP